MLKIKDNVDLKELEKFGWHLRKNCITDEFGAYTKGATEICLDIELYNLIMQVLVVMIMNMYMI